MLPHFKPLYTIREILGDKKAKPPIPALIPISRSTWYTGIAAGLYPKPVHFGKKRSFWRREDLLPILERGPLVVIPRCTQYPLRAPASPKPNPIIQPRLKLKLQDKLTDELVETAPIRARSYRLFDAGGLYLEVNPRGAKYWRIKYRFNKVEKKASLGIYPEVSLSDARLARDVWRASLAKDIDPMLSRRLKQTRNQSENTKLEETLKLCRQLVKSFEALGQIKPSEKLKYETALEGTKIAHRLIYDYLQEKYCQ